MITLTEKAAEEIQRVIGEQAEEAQKAGDPAPQFLRVSVKGGGCSGFEYVLDLSDAKGENDEVFDSYGVQLLCDPKSHLYLNGTTIDFKDGMMGRGFVFNNPNATSSCGCGSSFSA